MSLLLGIALMAETWIGISAYAGMAPNFPAGRFMRQFPRRIERPAIAVVWGSFGYDMRLIRLFTVRFAEQPHLIQIHISNECSRRSGRDGKAIAPWLTVAGYKKEIRFQYESLRDAVHLRVREILNTLAPFLTPNTRILFSTGLEADFGEQAHAIVAGWVREEIRAWKRKHPGSNVRVAGVIYSPNGHVDGYDHECHGLSARNCTYRNMDGQGICWGDGQQWECKHSPEKALEVYRAYDPKPRMFLLWDAAQQYGLGPRNFNAPLPYEGRSFTVTDEAIRGARKLLRQLGGI